MTSATNLILPAIFVGCLLAITSCSEKQTPAAESGPPASTVETPAPVNETPGKTTEMSSIVRGPHGSHDPHGKLTPDKLIQVALQHLQEGRRPEALMELDQAQQKFPDDTRILGVRASILLLNNEPAAAIRDLSRAIELEPGNAAHYVNRGQAYLHFERDDEAMQDFDRAVAIAPGMVAAHFNRGALRAQKSDNRGALEDFNSCIASDPHQAAPYFNRGSVYRLQGDNDKARADIERFLELTDNPKWKKAANDLLQYWAEQDAASPATGKPAS